MLKEYIDIAEKTYCKTKDQRFIEQIDNLYSFIEKYKL